MNPADIATRECRPKVLPKLWFHGSEFLEPPNEKWLVFETVPAIPDEVGIEELRTKLTVNALSMTKSNRFGIAKIIDCTQLVVTCSKLTIETLEQGVKYVQS